MATKVNSKKKSSKNPKIIVELKNGDRVEFTGKMNVVGGIIDLVAEGLKIKVLPRK